MAKASDKERELHQLILTGDDLALSKLYVLYGKSVINKLKGLYSKTDLTYIQEAVNDGLFGYFRNPKTFDPEKNTLLRFLEIAAERDLLNILQKEKKHLQTKKAPQNVELEEVFWNSIVREEKTTDGQLIHKESIEIVNKELAIHFDTERDLKLAKLVLSGERETDVFSTVLEIEKLTVEEQRKEVKKHKDRIKKVLERNDIESKLKNLLQ
jgi:RNA polymerase sigma-70 factor (ECF subfamily)